MRSRGSQEFPHILSLNSLYAFPLPNSLSSSIFRFRSDSLHSPYSSVIISVINKLFCETQNAYLQSISCSIIWANFKTSLATCRFCKTLFLNHVVMKLTNSSKTRNYFCLRGKHYNSLLTSKQTQLLRE